MKICQQVLLVTQESCANDMFEPSELFILRCALPQSIQLVGKTILKVCTHENSGCNHINCYNWQFDVVLWIHGCCMTKCICNWNVYSFLVHNFEWQVWERSDYESLYPWTNVNHMLLVNTYKWLLVGFQCELLSIQEVVELFHSPDSSKCLSFQILAILLSLCKSPVFVRALEA